jgi:hypothetical protein
LPAAASVALVEDIERLGEFAFRFEVLPTGAFFVDHEYQRPLTSLVSEIARNYNPFLIGAVIASDRSTSPPPHKRSRKPYIALIDGQTRWEGTIRAGRPDLLTVVYEGLRPEDEALIFALIQMKRRNMTSWQRWRAMYRAGDKDAQALKRIADESGWQLKPESDSGSLKAIAALEAVYRVDKDHADAAERGRLLLETLDVLRRAWPDELAQAGSADMIRGMGRFIEENDPDLDQLVRKLQRVTPSIVLFNATAYRAGRSGGSSRATSVAEAILAEYTKRTRGGNK